MNALTGAIKIEIVPADTREYFPEKFCVSVLFIVSGDFSTASHLHLTGVERTSGCRVEVHADVLSEMCGWRWCIYLCFLRYTDTSVRYGVAWIFSMSAGLEVQECIVNKRALV